MMRSRRGKRFVIACSVAVFVGSLVAPVPVAADVVTRPVVELLGEHLGYGIAGEGVSTATGNYTRTVTDLVVGSLELTRTYNSLAPDGGPFGAGWSLSLGAHLVLDDDSVAFHDTDGRVLSFQAEGEGGYRRPQDLDADLVRDPEGRFELRYLDGETWSFDQAGRMTAQRRPGTRVTLGYDGQSRLVTVTDSAGHRIDLGYDAEGRMSAARAGDGRTVFYGYATNDVLASVTGPGGLVERYETDPSGRIGKVVDAEGRAVVTVTYDEDGRVRRQDPGVGGHVDFDYRLDSGVTTLTATNGARLGYRHDAAGRLVELTDPAEGSIRQTFDENGRITAIRGTGSLNLELGYDTRGNLTGSTLSGATTRYAYDEQNRITAITEADGSTTRYEYTGDERTPSRTIDPNGAATTFRVEKGLVTATTDALGAETGYVYDTARRLVAVTDPLGNTTRYGYDAAGRNTAATTPLGHTTTYTYDSADRVVASVAPDGTVTRYRYSPSGQLLETIDPTGATRKTTYDPAGRPAATFDPIGNATAYSYDDDGNLAALTDPIGAVGRYEYDNFGRLSAVTAPDDGFIRYSYDADGQPTRETTPDGDTVTAYDGRGNVVAETDAAGRTTRYEYDAKDQLITITDPTGAVIRYRYDAAGRLVAETDPTGAVTRHEHDPVGRLITVTDPLGHVTRYGYDKSGRNTTITDPEGGVTRYDYDADGRLTAEVTPGGLVVQHEYDTNGREVATTDPRGGVIRYAYDANGRLVSRTSPGGSTQRSEYDAAGHLVRSIDANGAATDYTYDRGGNLTSITEPTGAVTRYTYDAAGKQTSTTDPLGNVTKQVYDPTGDLVSVTDPTGRTLRLEYNAVGELVRRTGHDGSTVSYSYDAAGRQTTMTDATGTTEYTYDPAGRLVSYKLPDGAEYQHTYDADGRRTKLRYPDGLEVSYEYDGNHRLVALTEPKAGRATYTLDADGHRTEEELPDRWSRKYEYDRGLLTGYQETQRGILVQDTTLTRDADGRITREERFGKRQNYTYDPAGQLLTATGGLFGAMEMTYDPAGNRTSIKRGAIRTELSYNAADQLVSTTTGPTRVDYTYDSSGRLLTRTGQLDRVAVSYDAFGRPSATTTTAGVVKQTRNTTYNGDDLPVEMRTTLSTSPLGVPLLEGTQRFQWTTGSVPQVLRQEDSTLLGLDKAKANFVYGYGRVFVDTPHHAATFSRDAYGSTLSTLGTAAWAEAPKYDVFGSPLEVARELTVSGPRFGYRGELAEGDWLFLRARSYDAETGRFTSRDPVEVMLGHVRPASPYTYADNDPLTRTDPRGEYAIAQELDALAAAVLSGVRAGAAKGGGSRAGGKTICDFDPGNSISKHEKCFQNRGPLNTRGRYDRWPDCLRGGSSCIIKMWQAGRRYEKAMQALAISTLGSNRGYGTSVSPDVDWEVTMKDSFLGFDQRVDIVADEREIFEVKEYSGPVTKRNVSAQLLAYVIAAHTKFGIVFSPSDELRGWAELVPVSDGKCVPDGTWGWQWVQDYAAVWGGETAGHVYFVKDWQDTPPEVRVKLQNSYDSRDEYYWEFCMGREPWEDKYTA